MRIDLNSPAVQNSQTERTARTKGERSRPSESATTDSGSSQDRVTLSSLAAKVLETPEIRREKVDTLRRAVQDGSYSLDSAAIADAMLGKTEK